MADPSVITLKEKIITKVATDVKSGVINRHWLKGRDMSYLSTTRATGTTAPTEKQMTDEGFLMFQFDTEQEIIESSESIDVYVYCNNGDSDVNDYGKLVVTV